jgi:hypothetical protein
MTISDFVLLRCWSPRCWFNIATYSVAVVGVLRSTTNAFIHKAQAELFRVQSHVELTENASDYGILE